MKNAGVICTANTSQANDNKSSKEYAIQVTVYAPVGLFVD